MPHHLRIPKGTESFYLEDALLHQALLRAFEDTCHSWSYLPVTTPVYDYSEAYRGVLSSDHETKSFRLIDRTGDLLILRPDVTLFLARQMALILQANDLPLRVYYGDTILRHEDPYHPSKDEYFQVGAELIGLPGLEAEAEMVLLLFDALDHWSAGEVVVHVGHRGILSPFRNQDQLASAIAQRNWSETRALLVAQECPPAQVKALLELFRFIGTTGELEALIPQHPDRPTTVTDALTHLLDLAREAEALGYAERIRIDLSEVGSQHYHSGVVFQAYAQGVSAPVASGGRYDGLLGRFGFQAPSVGFSVMLRRIQGLLHGNAHAPVPDVETADGPSFTDRALAARAARKRGKVVRL